MKASEETVVEVVPDVEIKAVEDWATAKGMFPQMIAPPARAPMPAQNVGPGVVGSVLMVNISRDGGLAPRTNPSFWKFAAAKAHNQWPIGLTMTEAEFDKAIVAATDGITLR